MTIIPPGLEKVPLSEVADVLTEAVRRSSGGPIFVAMAHGRDLAAALEFAGFTVVRPPPPRPQLTL
jgi:hypothetical protein